MADDCQLRYLTGLVSLLVREYGISVLSDAAADNENTPPAGGTPVHLVEETRDVISRLEEDVLLGRFEAGVLHWIDGGNLRPIRDGIGDGSVFEGLLNDPILAFNQAEPNGADVETLPVEQPSMATILTV